MPILLRKSHNVTTLLYHLVFPVKYRRFIFTTPRIQNELIDECYKIQDNYGINFETIWIDWDHLHYIVQWEPTLSVSRIITMIKSFTWKRLKKCALELEWKLRWKEIWSDWFFANTVWASAWFDVIHNYVFNQWYWSKWYKARNFWTERMMQPSLFNGA